MTRSRAKINHSGFDIKDILGQEAREREGCWWWETMQVTCEKRKRRTKKEGHHGNQGPVLGRSGDPP